MTKNIFELSQKEKNKLGIIEQKPRPRFKDRFIEIFDCAKRLGKEGLSIDEITIGYYNLYCKNNPNEPICNVNKIRSRLNYNFYGNIRKRLEGIYDEVNRHWNSDHYLYKVGEKYIYLDRECIQNTPMDKLITRYKNIV